MQIETTPDGRQVVSSFDREKILGMAAKTAAEPPEHRPRRTDLRRSNKKRPSVAADSTAEQTKDPVPAAAEESSQTAQQRPRRRRPPVVDAFALMPEGAAGADIPAPMYPSMFDFVMCELVSTYGQSQGRVPNWSAIWYRHPEAVRRLDALWRKFEKLRVDDPFSFRESFYHRYADYHMDRLMKSESVFADCKRDDVPMQPLPTAQMKTTYVRASRQEA
ncbi:hypothetical protein C1Y63_06170 [Corynebacterium sp. 13CS0277]|uniref:DUF4913 domain-containing protein n=1 Tax=Corynebacterium sp. 13CS0277 TaxID=2071994 RepID=UPI000D0294D1|nr:DUF4913 domain-containing protein [Corynebacterium sp. 13CS0277]PRQ11433.1 hypothetical protein C1Y63_06170 [Corynebacterium sp. 13CS0277]